MPDKLNNSNELIAGPPSFGLYLHIPYCAALCPYCDFAKTANFDRPLALAYLARLGGELTTWLAKPEIGARLVASGGFQSVFLGGGTPSLYTEEYAELFALIRPRLAPGAEVTLEANPDDCTPERLTIWRRLGVNRLSIGIQSFQDAGLKVLQRSHGGDGAAAALTAARATFDNVNADLIYGWPGQALRGFDDDLRQATRLGATHLSLYNLTFESRTPLGRAAHRGLTGPQGDGRLARYYSLARQRLEALGFEQDEVSNWALPGFTCRHNWLYWSDQSYLGVGTGAHGYFADDADAGRRYAYSRHDREFVRRAAEPIYEEPRTLDHWLTEVVASSLRTTRGVDLRGVERRVGRSFRASPLIAEGIDRSIISIDQVEGRLRLAPAEWFREAGWATHVLAGFS